MSDYKEASLTGKKWQRAHTIHIMNSHGGIPWIKFIEETITELSDGNILHTPAGELIGEFTDPATEFTLLNPADNSAIGIATYGEIQVMLYSLYFHLVNIRDNS